MPATEAMREAVELVAEALSDGYADDGASIVNDGANMVGFKVNGVEYLATITMDNN